MSILDQFCRANNPCSVPDNDNHEGVLVLEPGYVLAIGNAEGLQRDDLTGAHILLCDFDPYDDAYYGFILNRLPSKKVSELFKMPENTVSEKFAFMDVVNSCDGNVDLERPVFLLSRDDILKAHGINNKYGDFSHTILIDMKEEDHDFLNYMMNDLSDCLIIEGQVRLDRDEAEGLLRQGNAVSFKPDPKDILHQSSEVRQRRCDKKALQVCQYPKAVFV